MNPMFFYIAAFIFCVISYLQIRKATLSMKAAVVPAKKSAERRLIGRMLLGLAASFAGMGVLAQVLAD